MNHCLIRSASHDYLAKDQTEYIQPPQPGLYRLLAKRQIGLMITGQAYVHISGKASPLKK